MVMLASPNYFDLVKEFKERYPVEYTTIFCQEGQSSTKEVTKDLHKYIVKQTINNIRIDSIEFESVDSYFRDSISYSDHIYYKVDIPKPNKFTIYYSECVSFEIYDESEKRNLYSWEYGRCNFPINEIYRYKYEFFI